MQDLKTLLTDIWRIVHGAVRRASFWSSYLQLTALMLLLAGLLFWPALRKARDADRIQLARIFEDRRRVMQANFARIDRFLERIRRADSREARLRAMDTLTETDRFPGIVAVGFASTEGRDVRMVPDGLVFAPGAERSGGLWASPDLREAIVRAANTGSNTLSALFWEGQPTKDPSRAFLALVMSLPGGALVDGVQRPAAVFCLLNLGKLILESGRPFSFDLLDLRLSNTQGDHTTVDLTRTRRNLGTDRSDLIEVSPVDPEDSQGFEEMRRTLSAEQQEDMGPDNEDRFARGKSALIRMTTFPGRDFKVTVVPSAGFRRISSMRALIVAAPYYLVHILVTGFLLVLMWTVFSASRNQMRELSEAQGTIARLNLHRTLVQQELHDHIIQNLTLLGVKVATTRIEDAEGFRRTRDAVLQQLDYLRRELRRLLVEGTERLQSFDEMVVQLQSICRHMEKQFGVRCQLTTSNPGGLTLHPEILFRTCRFAEELMGNAIRHGRARNLTMRVECLPTPPTLVLKVADDGVGFDPDAYSAGFGLQSLNAFARRSRGRLSIERRPNRGMTIELTLPVKSAVTPP